jgi:hypothetical protein
MSLISYDCNFNKTDLQVRIFLHNNLKLLQYGIQKIPLGGKCIKRMKIENVEYVHFNWFVFEVPTNASCS